MSDSSHTNQRDALLFTPRSSLDHSRSRSSSLYSTTTTAKTNMETLQSVGTAFDLSGISLDDPIAPLVLALSFSHSQTSKRLSKEGHFLMTVACCLLCLLCVHVGWLILGFVWLIMMVSSVFLLSLDRARLFCQIGQCGVVLSSVMLVLYSYLLEPISMNGWSSAVVSWWSSWMSASMNDAFATFITGVSDTKNPTWSWFHGVVWMCCMGLFHVVQRLCDHQDEERRVAQRQQCEAQRQVDQYLEEVAGIRERFVDTLGREIQEATMMVMSTLEQFSPVTLLNNTHELLSPCSMPIPVTNITAIHTTINEIGHIGSHLHLVSRLLRREQACVSSVCRDFDIGEMIQTVGDALAAIASKIGISVILYHMDNGLHCINVLGDEDAIKHGIICLLRNIMEGCTPGACIEVGLNAESHRSDRLQITFDITQTRSHAIPHGVPNSELSLSVYTTELIRYSGGLLSVDKMNETKTRCLVLYDMQSGSDNAKRRLIMERSIHDLRNNIQYASEPTLMELIDFVGKLKGMRMILYATEKSMFAKHLTSCLASWNVDISHMPTNTAASNPSSHFLNLSMNSPLVPGSSSSPASTSSSGVSVSTPTAHKAPTPVTEEDHIHSIPPAFLLIDDDIPTLERQLLDYRNQQLQQQQQQQQSTPVTPSYFAPMLSFQQEPINKRHRRQQQQRTIAIIYFSYLKDYRKVREVILQHSSASAYPLSVFIVPKPSGPRRFLTALHSAWQDAIVDPQFAPMATSPSNHPARMTTPTGIYPPTTPNTDLKRISPAPQSDESNYFSARHSSSSSGGNTKPISSPSSAATGPGSRSPSNHRRLRSHSNASLGSNNSRRMVDLAFSTTEPDRPTLDTTPADAMVNDLEAHDASALRISITPSVPESTASSTPQQQSLVDRSLVGNGMDENMAPSDPGTTPNDAQQSQQQQQENQKAIDSTPPLRMAGPSAIETPSMMTPDPSLASAAPATPATEKVSSPPPKRNLKFKISNRKKKDKKHTPWWSPPIKVLIVEDNMINQAILSTWMKKHNIKFEVSSDGKQALEKWKKGGFHLILMDIQLPVMSGIDATKMIRAIEKEKNIGVLPSKWDDSQHDDHSNETPLPPSPTQLQVSPSSSPDDKNTTTSKRTSSKDSFTSTTFQSPVIIVALTASSHESDRQAALAAGCNDFLTKPVSLEWLEKKIMEWGCMQALIDVEGWRQWKRSTTTSTLATTLPNHDAIASPSSSLDKTLALLKSSRKGSISPKPKRRTYTEPVRSQQPSPQELSPSIVNDKPQGILLQGSASLFNKRTTAKSRVASRESTVQ